MSRQCQEGSRATSVILRPTFQPRLHSLKIPNDSLIIPRSHLRSNNTNNHKVQLPHPRILPPFWMGINSQSFSNIDIRRCHLCQSITTGLRGSRYGDPARISRGVWIFMIHILLSSPFLLSLNEVNLLLSCSSCFLPHASLSFICRC